MTIIFFLFVLNNIVWMIFLSLAVYALMPEAKRKNVRLPKIKNPLAPKPKPFGSNMEEVSEASLDDLAKANGMKTFNPDRDIPRV